MSGAGWRTNTARACWSALHLPPAASRESAHQGGRGREGSGMNSRQSLQLSQHLFSLSEV
jgi:hypothetical protein